MLQSTKKRNLIWGNENATAIKIKKRREYEEEEINKQKKNICMKMSTRFKRVPYFGIILLPAELKMIKKLNFLCNCVIKII